MPSASINQRNTKYFAQIAIGLNVQSLIKHGFSPREVLPQGSGSIRVMIVGESPGEQEDAQGIPFSPYAPAGSVLERAIRRVGMSREQFVITNVVPFRPPKNWLEGAPWEHEAITTCRPLLERSIERFQPRIILALGGVALRATTGLSGDKLGVTSLAGFLLPGLYCPVVPSFHPSYLRRGKMSHMGVLMRCIKLAVEAAKCDLKPVEPPVDKPPPGYLMYPTPEQAEAYLKDAKVLAYDIETNYSTDEEEAEEEEAPGTIRSIQFSAGPNSGVYLPWREPYIGIAKRLLDLSIPKLGWNNWRFDDPLLKACDAPVRGPNHDLMWMWHHLQPDLPRGLQFAAAQNGWPWPWKHLAAAREQFYGIVDVDVLHYLWD